MVTGNVEATSNSLYISPVLEDGIAKLLNSLECQNVYTEDLPPLTTETEFTERLQVHKGFAQPDYEAWFASRQSVSHEESVINSSHHYNQVHGIMITGMAFHGTFHRSYQYMQDKTDELMWTLEKNKDLLGDSAIEFITGISTTFSFDEFGDMYLYRSETTFDVHRVVSDERSFSN